MGEIEFEAEGSAVAVEQQRVNFMNAVLPAAVNAMVQTRALSGSGAYIGETTKQQLLESENTDFQVSFKNEEKVDFSRTSLSSFLKKFGVLSDQDFTLFAAYFYEKKNGITAFSIENVKQYYQEGRRQPYSNNAVLLRYLVKKGYIMDASVPEGAKSGSYYMLTDDGIAYIEAYVPKENSEEKKKVSSKRGKTKSTISSYSHITADDLNLGAYPCVKDLKGSKEQVIVAMYILTTEVNAEWFNWSDLEYILINIFEIPANKKTIYGMFDKVKSWFKTEPDTTMKNGVRRKLLSGAKDFAKDVIEQNK